MKFKMDELYDYYILEAYSDIDLVLEKLNKLEESDKIIYSIDDDIIHIENLFMTNSDIKKLLIFFEENDVIGYDIEDEDDDNGFIDYDFFNQDDY